MTRPRIPFLAFVILTACTAQVDVETPSTTDTGGGSVETGESTDSGPTTGSLASCGDGVVQAPEVCDGGGETPSCDVDCTAAGCGDGVVNLMAGEVCDDGNPADGDGCESSCTVTGEPGSAKFVFVTSEVYTGDLGGLAGADAKCQALAEKAKLPGTYMAWLSDDTGSPATRMKLSTGPYRRPDGTTVANSWADYMLYNALLAPINMTETGGTPAVIAGICEPTLETLVWTNTDNFGKQLEIGSSCSSWTSASGLSNQGKAAATDSWWTAYCNAPCSYTFPLYCFEQ